MVSEKQQKTKKNSFFIGQDRNLSTLNELFLATLNYVEPWNNKHPAHRRHFRS